MFFDVSAKTNETKKNIQFYGIDLMIVCMTEYLFIYIYIYEIVCVIVFVCGSVCEWVLLLIWIPWTMDIAQWYWCRILFLKKKQQHQKRKKLYKIQ